MYNNKLVVAIKTNGKVLREFKDQIRIPFGAEYSIYIKNLNSVRALVKVEIDGKDIGGGTRFVVHPNSEVEIERSISNGNFNEGNCFKFIERTSRVEDARGVGAEDGLIRVEFQFERPYVKPDLSDYLKQLNQQEVHHHHHYKTWDVWKGPYYYTTSSNSDGSYNDMVLRSTAKGIALAPPSATYSANSISTPTSANLVYACASAAPMDDVGITVPGSLSDQKFQNALFFPTETEKHVVVLKIVGELESGEKVVEAVTVKPKPKCITCNHINKANAKYCSECGTSLTVL